MELLDSKMLVCALPNTSEKFEVDLEAILISERRQDEIAFLTKEKAPELMAHMNSAWRDLYSLIRHLTWQKSVADKELGVRRSIIILEEAPVYLKNKGLQSNEANREALIALDPEAQRLQNVTDEIEAVIEYMRGKLKSFDNAFTAAKKILGGNDFNNGYKNEHLTGDSYVPTKQGFGKGRI